MKNLLYVILIIAVLILYGSGVYASDVNPEVSIQSEVSSSDEELKEMASSTYRNVVLGKTKIKKANHKKINYKKIKYAQKYEIRISENKKMNPVSIYFTKRTSFKINDLDKNKTYYVKVRGLTRNMDKTISYSKWTKPFKIKQP